MSWSSIRKALRNERSPAQSVVFHPLFPPSIRFAATTAVGADEEPAITLSHPPLRLYAISDFHLELSENVPHAKKAAADLNSLRMNTPRDDCDHRAFLALLGDIGDPFSENYQSFVRARSEEFSEVFLVAGNHEFYFGGRDDKTLQSTREQILQFCRNAIPRQNVHFLDAWAYLREEYGEDSDLRDEQEEEVFVDGESGIRFVGSTLWTNVEPGRWRDRVQLGLNDYSCVQTRDDVGRIRVLSIKDTVRCHDFELEFIEKHVRLAAEANQTVVVLTHHSPVWRMKPKQTLLGPAWATRLEDRLKYDQIQVWCYGHIHHSVDFFVEHPEHPAGGSHAYSNSLGYCYSHEKTGWNSGSYVEVYSFEGRLLRDEGKFGGRKTSKANSDRPSALINSDSFCAHCRIRFWKLARPWIGLCFERVERELIGRK